MKSRVISLLSTITPAVIKDLTISLRMFLRLRVCLIANFFPKYFGLYDLDRKLEKYLDYEKGYFVELGANNGVSQSNTKYFELFKKWSGVLIEAESNNFHLCKRYRARRTKVYNAACVSFSYPKDKVEMIFSNLMSIALDGESDISNREGHAQDGVQFLDKGEVLHKFFAPARTLNSILLESDSPNRIDLLSLDVEGAELEVLKGIDHQLFRFKYMLIEVRDLQGMEAFLKERGYFLVEQLSGHDYLFADSR